MRFKLSMFASSRAWLIGCATAALASGCARAYPVSGLVLSIDRPAATVTVSHEAIDGFMDAMVMPLGVRDRAALDGLAPGDRIRFRLVVGKDRSYVDRVEVLSAARTDRGLLETPAAPALVPIGRAVPDFELIDQHGRRVSLAAHRGRVVVVTFIYTRCPLPDYCPRMVSNFKAVGDRFANRLGRDLTLLTITFDPTFDTVETLKTYAGAMHAERDGWHFLTGTSEAIARVCGLFGIEYWPEEGLITHTLQTAVVDREGRLAGTIEGKDYTGRQVGDFIQAVLGNPADR